MQVDITPQEVAETLSMVSEQNLDLRTITMGISLAGCADEDMGRMCDKVYDRITTTAENLVQTADDLQNEYGIPIANKRVSVTPVAQIAAGCKDEDLSPIAHAMDRAAETLGIDFMGGFSALVQKGIGATDRKLINSVPEALATTERVCSSLNIASTRAGINMDAVLLSAQTILECARRTVDIDCYGAAKFVVFANMVEDSPFMAGAVHGSGEADAVINVGVSGPGVMAAALSELPTTRTSCRSPRRSSRRSEQSACRTGGQARKQYIIDAFTDRVFSGNPAAICVLDRPTAMKCSSASRGRTTSPRRPICEKPARAGTCAGSR